MYIYIALKYTLLFKDVCTGQYYKLVILLYMTILTAPTDDVNF